MKEVDESRIKDTASKVIEDFRAFVKFLAKKVVAAVRAMEEF